MSNIVTTCMSATDNILVEEKSIITIGFFDGMHVMHQKILKEAKEAAVINKMPFIVFTFDKKVSLFLQNKEDYLMSYDERITAINELVNPDLIVIMEVNEETTKKSAQEFIDYMKNNLNVSGVYVGSDFKFGSKASGNIEFLLKEFNNGYTKVFKRDYTISSSILRDSKK